MQSLGERSLGETSKISDQIQSLKNYLKEECILAKFPRVSSCCQEAFVIILC